MPAIDIILRVSAASVLLITAALLLASAPRDRKAWLFAPLAFGLAGFLAGNTPDSALQLSGFADAFASFLSRNAAVFLWWFCLAAFDDDFAPRRTEWGVAAVWMLLALSGRVLPGVDMSWPLIAIGAGMLVHLGWRVLSDQEDDLVEGRRRARLAVVASIALLLAVDFIIDLAMGTAWRPQAFTIAQNAAILGIALWLALWALAPRPGGYLALKPRARQPQPAPAPAEARLRERLERLMAEEQPHLDPGLTFAALSARLGVSEAEARKLINHALGFRHFRTFLNTWRVAEAKRLIDDPARADRKMTAVAFDSGFASLASFNRAFKEIAGVSPSDYRTGNRPVEGFEERLTAF